MALGYPLHFIVLLGVWKVLGAADAARAPPAAREGVGLRRHLHRPLRRGRGVGGQRRGRVPRRRAPRPHRLPRRVLGAAPGEPAIAPGEQKGRPRRHCPAPRQLQRERTRAVAMLTTCSRPCAGSCRRSSRRPLRACSCTGRDARREPPWLVVLTFVLGAVAALVSLLVVGRAAALTGLDVRVSAAGESGALVFLFFVVAPTQEAVQGRRGVARVPVEALRRALRRRRLRRPPRRSASPPSRTASSCTRTRPAASGSRAPLLALPAHVFFACLWGYALGRAKQSKRACPSSPPRSSPAIARTASTRTSSTAAARGRSWR